MTTVAEAVTGQMTDNQLDLVMRCIDGRTGEPFYRVQSETDPLADYTVRAIQMKGKYYCTCTCPCGQKGFANAKGYCKHVRWSLAHARLYRELTKARITDRFPLPHSTIVSWTVQEGLASLQVLQYVTGFSCDCNGFQYETGPFCKPPTHNHCCHIAAVQAELRRVAEETALYLREVATAA